VKRIETDPEPLPGTIDAHAHTWSRELREDHEAVLARAWASGLTDIVEVGVDAETSRAALALAEREPRVHPVLGLHPHEAEHLDAQREALEGLADGGGFVAIGEIGLDFFRNLSPPDQQDTAFRWQLELARSHELPVVIHSRDADEASYAILEEWAGRVGRYLGVSADGRPREIGMMHCYAGDAELAARYGELGFLISVPGTVTYPSNQRGQDVARSTPLAGMLLETDCPYLTPVPHRGRRNEPAYVVETARYVASLRGEAPERVAAATAENARRLFGFA
jgi:TatD DNase family protein